MDYSNLFVVLMGICTVFIGLICIIIIVSIMGSVCRKMVKEAPAASTAVPAAAPQQSITPEIVAALSAAIAENMGAEVSAIRIKNIKKI